MIRRCRPKRSQERGKETERDEKIVTLLSEDLLGQWRFWRVAGSNLGSDRMATPSGSCTTQGRKERTIYARGCSYVSFAAPPCLVFREHSLADWRTLAPAAPPGQLRWTASLESCQTPTRTSHQDCSPTRRRSCRAPCSSCSSRTESLGE